MSSAKAPSTNNNIAPPLTPGDRDPAYMLTQEEIDALREDAIKADALLDKAFADLRPSGKKD